MEVAPWQKDCGRRRRKRNCRESSNGYGRRQLKKKKKPRSCCCAPWEPNCRRRSQRKARAYPADWPLLRASQMKASPTQRTDLCRPCRGAGGVPRPCYCSEEARSRDGMGRRPDLRIAATRSSCRPGILPPGTFPPRLSPPRVLRPSYLLCRRLVI